MALGRLGAGLESGGQIGLSAEAPPRRLADVESIVDRCEAERAKLVSARPGGLFGWLSR